MGWLAGYLRVRVLGWSLRQSALDHRLLLMHQSLRVEALVQ